MMDLLVFRAGEARWGIDVTRVREILDVIAVTPLPGLPGWIRGILDLRGRLLPVLDFRLLSGVEPAGREATIVLAIAGEREFAVTVDGVETTESIDPSAVEPDPERTWTRGVAAGIAIIDPETLLEVNP
jgi:purine-binding chemotaxis protein CheW